MTSLMRRREFFGVASGNDLALPNLVLQNKADASHARSNERSLGARFRTINKAESGQAQLFYARLRTFMFISAFPNDPLSPRLLSGSNPLKIGGFSV